MYRALYDFDTEQKYCLSFKSDDLFTETGDRDRSGDWLLVKNGLGQTGLVPYNYVAVFPNQGNGVIDDVLKSIDRAIEGIHYASSRTGTYTKEQRMNLQALLEHRRKVATDQKTTSSKIHVSTNVSSTDAVPPQPKRTAPMLSPSSDPTQPPTERIDNKRPCTKREAPAPPIRTSSQLQATTPQDPEPPVTMPYSVTTHISQMNTQHCTTKPEAIETPTSRDNVTTTTTPVAEQSSDSQDGIELQKCDALVTSGTSSRYHTRKTEELGVSVPSVTSTVTSAPQIDADLPSPPDEKFLDFPQPPDISTLSCFSEVFEDCLDTSFPLRKMSTADHTDVSLNSTLVVPDSGGEISVPESLGSELVEDVRRKTGLSYNNTLIAVETVIKLIGSHVPSTHSIMEKVAKVLYEAQDKEVDLDDSHDAQRLGVLFSELRACKDDAQQRSWALHEDKTIILQHLQEMISILQNANPKVCRKCIAADHYEPLHTLVQYYQMETRGIIRMTMLKGFETLCHLDATAVTALLYSVLPLELCTDLQSNITDSARTCSSANVLTMVLSMGEEIPMPVHHYVHLNKQFVCFLLDKIEAPPAEDVTERIPDFFVRLILAFNLQFHDWQNNFVMTGLGERGTATVFTEKLMMLVNRGDDPVRILPHKPQPANSLLKFLTDMYSDPATSDLLYTNDAKVLIDIIIRQLSDLPAGHQARTENLILVRLILTNSPYKEEKYRLDDLHRSLLNILKEEVQADNDKAEVKKIFSGHPDLFPSLCC